MQQKLSVFVNNVPEYARKHRYIAVHIVDGEPWFYGAFDKKESAEKAALEYARSGIQGFVVLNEND